MTHPPATCELCGDTGLYSPSALPCPKGCSAEDIVDRLRAHDLDLSPDWRDDVDMHSWMDTADALMAEAAEYITNMRQYISELEQLEKDARSKLQAMHRRAQASERVEQMIIDTLSGWYRLYLEGSLKNRARRGLFYTVMKELKTKAENVRSARNALKDEVR